LGRKAFPEFDGHKLATLCERLNIKLENHHRALDDAYACMIVAARCFEKAIADNRNIEMILQNSFQFTLDQFKENSFYQLPKHLREMEEYLGKNKSILIRYDGGTENRNELRTIRPVAILPLPAGSILYALCEKDNHHKSFKIKKIKEWSLP
jgi:DNA polymerase III epsilon subunit-like protein